MRKLKNSISVICKKTECGQTEAVKESEERNIQEN